MRPLGGSGVVASMPASRSAALLAQAEWPSREWMSTARSGSTRSSDLRSGRPSGKAAMDQPLPMIQGRSVPAAYAAMAWTYASALSATSDRSHRRRSSPPMVGWECESPKPGSSRRPPRSMVRVEPRASLATSTAGPTATMRPPATATESAPRGTPPDDHSHPPERISSGHGRASLMAGKSRRPDAAREPSGTLYVRDPQLPDPCATRISFDPHRVLWDARRQPPTRDQSLPGGSARCRSSCRAGIVPSFSPA